jgi:hypothetical protein
MKFIKVTLVAIAFALLTACGGGGGTVTAISTVQDPCAIASHRYGDIQVPTLYAGSYTVPVVTNKLPSSIARGMDLKDLDAWWSKPSSVLCTDKSTYLKNVYVEDLNRLQQLGVERVTVYNYADWDNVANSLMTISKNNYAIPDSTLKIIVDEATKRGIKVYLVWQGSYGDKINGYINQELITPVQLMQLMDSHKANIVAQAVYAQRIGIAGIDAELQNFTPTVLKTDPVLNELYVTKTAEIIDAIRAVYNGKIFYGAQYSPVIDSRIISKIDEYVYLMWLGSYPAGQAFTTASEVIVIANQISAEKARIETAMNGVAFNKPIVWDIYAQSTSEFYNGGYVEDSYCNGACPIVVTDFSKQAIAIDAALQVISTQQLFTTASVTVSNYWNRDEIAPTQVGDMSTNMSFPNISSSIRNKPAELIIKNWYSK